MLRHSRGERKGCIMRRGDRKIKKLKSKDVDALKMLGRTGHVKSEILKDYTGITQNRINTLKNLSYLSEVYDNNSDDRYLRLTKRGRDFVYEQLGVVCYKSNAPVHDSEIVDYYMKMTREEQESIQTETELQQIIRAEFEEENFSPTDFSYVSSDGEVIYVEVITSNYSESQIEEKIEFVNVMGGTYNEIRI